jgi:peptide/nickel transport system substrate-binding protein
VKDNMSKKLFIAFTLIIALLAILIVYEQSRNKRQNMFSNEPIKEELVKELKLGIVSLDTFNPIISNNKYVHQIGKLIYEPLVNISHDYKLEPMLAKEWAKTSENTYIIKLKEGIKFSSGNELASKDVIYTINSIKSAENSIFKDNVSNISNATQIDEYTVKLDLNDGNEMFFAYNLIFPIVEEESYSGTGMFKVLETEEKKIILEKNSHSEKEQELKINTIIINLFDSVGEMYNSFKFKGIDFLTTTRLDYMDYIGTLGYGYKEIKTREFTFLAINTQEKILSNSEVRLAIKYGVDKESIVSKLFSNKHFAADFPLDYGSYLYNVEDRKSYYDPEKAKQVLLENGWEYKNNLWQKRLGNNVETIRISIAVDSNNEEKMLVAGIIKEQLEAIRNNCKY